MSVDRKVFLNLLESKGSEVQRPTPKGDFYRLHPIGRMLNESS
jgi:hypothetical protein